ncbi:MAG: SCP2 sterol-binding domain-containing protein [Deltaproteobacteria bacterium]|nr:SCP2 sterol-binding domain-containing protein [Deltaproteobacteria bacterium]
MTTVRAIFERMPETFVPEKAVGMNAVVQFDITGEGGGLWHAAIVDGVLSVVEGRHPSPQLTLSASAPDYVAISTGKLKGQLAFMTGRLKASGNLALAMKMQAIFRGP